MAGRSKDSLRRCMAGTQPSTRPCGCSERWQRLLQSQRLKNEPRCRPLRTASCRHSKVCVLLHGARPQRHALCLHSRPEASAAHHFGIADAIADEHALAVHQHDHGHADVKHRACQLQEGLCAPRSQSGRAATPCPRRLLACRPVKVPGRQVQGGLRAMRSNTTRHQARAGTACKVEPAAARYR